MLNPRYIVVTFDEHVPPSMNRGAWSSRPEIRGDVERALLFVDDWCEKHHNEGIVRISCGDTFDSSEPEPDRLMWLANYFKKHMENCQQYLYILGQHDRVARCPHNPWLEVVCQNPKMVYAHRRITTIAGRYFLFHDNTSTTELFNWVNEWSSRVADKAPSATLIAHQLWHPWLPIARPIPSLLALPSNITNVFSGDYHVKKSEWLECHDGHLLNAWSGGPLTPQDISEENDCRFLVIDTSNWSYESVPVPSRPILRLDVQTDADLDKAVDQIMQHKKHHDMTSVEVPLLRVKYLANLDSPYRRISDAAEGRFHLFCDPIVATGSGLDQQLYSRHDVQDLQGAIDKSVKVPVGSLGRSVVNIAIEAKSPVELTAKLDELKTAFMERKKNVSGEAKTAEVLPASGPHV